MGLLGWGRWKFWKSTWKVTDHDDHSFCVLSALLSPSFRSLCFTGTTVPSCLLLTQNWN